MFPPEERDDVHDDDVDCVCLLCLIDAWMLMVGDRLCAR